MRIIQNKKTKVLATTCLMIIFGIISGWSWTYFSKNGISFASTKPIHITVKNQEGVPLLISATHTDSNVFKPRYGYSLTNVSDKTIRAFTIQEDVFFGSKNAQQSGAVFKNLSSETNVLRPNASRHENAGGNTKYSEEVNEIVLSVDFVEFNDGTTWGVDKYNSAERLAGYRAGAKMALEWFSQKLEAKSFEAFTNEIDADAVNFALQADKSKSSTWKDGFEYGVGIIRNRLKKAIKEEGLKGVKEALQKPFDTSERRQEK